jgi:hypothetical protein
MVEFNKFRAEKYLIETLARAVKSGSAYKVLYVHISKLKPKNRHPKFVKIIARLFDDLVVAANGTMFMLSNGDLVLLGKEITEKVVEGAVAKLRQSFVTDPIWANHSSSEFTHLYQAGEFQELIKKLEDMQQQPIINEALRQIPVEAGQIEAVKQHLDEMNIVDIIKHQSVLRLDNTRKFHKEFEEFFVAVKDLSRQFDATIDLVGNKWLFLYLTQVLDKKTMYSFMFASFQNKPKKVSLNLNLSTIFLPEFEEFLQRLSAEGQTMIAEVQVMDIFNNLAAYRDAKELLHKAGHEILIDATSIEMLQALNIKLLGADSVKLFWHALMEEYNHTDALKPLFSEIGTDKLILAKCLDDKALRWGMQCGIRAFQGPYIDALEVALIRAKCPQGRICSAEDCLKRKRLIAGARRNECMHPEFLERGTDTL